MSFTSARARVAALSRSRAADDPVLIEARDRLEIERQALKDRLPQHPAVQRPGYVTLVNGGDYMGVCAATIRRGIAKGELTGYKFGISLRVRLADLDRWAESKAMPNPNAPARPRQPRPRPATA